MREIPVSKIAVIALVILILGVGFLVLKNKKIALPKNSVVSENCNQENSPYLDSSLSVEDRVNDLMSRMDDQEKIGQMLLIEKNSIKNLNDITRYNLGALLSGGGAGPKSHTPVAWLQMINSFQEKADSTCLRIPLLYGIDAIHGHGNVYGATIFPHFIGLGATQDPELVRKVAEATAKEMAATGIYWSYSPNLDVVTDTRWGKTYETFGSDTVNVARLGLAYLQGTQDSSANYLNVLANPKHYLGGGSMVYGTARNRNFKIEEGNIILEEDVLRQVHLLPFQVAVAGGARAIMIGTATWKGVMNSANYYLLTEVLKDELGFSGFIVSDWYGVYQISSSKYESLVIAVNAGVDMVMAPFDYKDFISNMQKAKANGDISQERIDDAVRRILTVKFETGLFDRPQADSEGLSVIGSDEHRQLAREAVRKSQVLLKNENSVLPLSIAPGKILVAGSASDNLGRQAGGWTTEWQGIDGNYGIVGTTVLQAIRDTISESTEIEYNRQGLFSQNDNIAEIGVVVVGEEPYAEGWGDKDNPSLSSEDLLAIERTRMKSKKVIVVIISGRPLDIAAYTKDWDAIVAAWLPGSEGSGVTDTLFGFHPFTGVLPLSWDY